jgi:hypothetical protein
MDRRVGAGLDQVLGRVLAGRHAHHPDPGAVSCLDVARSVAAGEAAVPVERVA